jgi:carboxymethylenebutenolidase
MDSLESQGSLEAHVRSLAAKTEFSRRGFVVTSLATGFALAVQPVAAQTVITTDAKGLEAGEVKIPVADGSIPAYRAVPDGGVSFPIVLVVQEIFGVHEHIKDICRRIAKMGYLAVAPALYARQGDTTKMTDFKEIFAIVGKVPDKEVASDLDSTVAWAAANKGDANRLGIVGFCWGGRQTWLYAEHNPKLKAAVAWYGPLGGEVSENTPHSVIDGVKDLKAPVLGLYGGADQNIPLSDIEKMRAALKAAGKNGDIIVYPDAPHGFNADYRPSYRADAAKDGWDKMKEWFTSHGVV